MVKLKQAICAPQTKPGAKKGAIALNDKLSLNYKQITTLQDSGLFLNIKRLFLSHNLLISLDGIQSFPNLSHLSVSHNHLSSITELFKISNPQRLEGLAVAGNYFIDRDPDFVQKLLVQFTNLKELDCQPLTGARHTMQDCKALKQILIPFMLKLDGVAAKVTDGVDDKDYSELIEILDSCHLNKTSKVSVSHLYQLV